MIKFTGVFDNSIASPMKPLDFVKEYYLSTMGRKELVDSSIQQESTFAALKNEESAQHSLQQLKAKIAAFAERVNNVVAHNPVNSAEIVSIVKAMRQLSAV